LVIRPYTGIRQKLSENKKNPVILSKLLTEDGRMPFDPTLAFDKNCLRIKNPVILSKLLTEDGRMPFDPTLAFDKNCLRIKKSCNPVKTWFSDSFCGRDEQVLPNSIRPRCNLREWTNAIRPYTAILQIKKPVNPVKTFKLRNKKPINPVYYQTRLKNESTNSFLLKT
jgi:hypothetical protein